MRLRGRRFRNERGQDRVGTRWRRLSGFARERGGNLGRGAAGRGFGNRTGLRREASRDRRRSDGGKGQLVCLCDGDGV